MQSRKKMAKHLRKKLTDVLSTLVSEVFLENLWEN